MARSWSLLFSNLGRCRALVIFLALFTLLEPKISAGVVRSTSPVNGCVYLNGKPTPQNPQVQCRDSQTGIVYRLSLVPPPKSSLLTRPSTSARPSESAYPRPSESPQQAPILNDSSPSPFYSIEIYPSPWPSDSMLPGHGDPD